MDTLQFYEKPETGNLYALFDGGIVIVREGITKEQALEMLESGEGVSIREGVYQGEPSSTVFVGWGDARTPVFELKLKKLAGRKMSRPAIKITVLN